MNSLEEALAKLQQDRENPDKGPIAQMPSTLTLDKGHFTWEDVRQAITNDAIVAPLVLTIANHNERMAFRRRIYRLLKEAHVPQHKVTVTSTTLTIERKYPIRALGITKQTESS